MVLIDTEYDCFCKTVVFGHEIGQVPGNGLGTGLQGDNPLEVLGLILIVRYLPAIAIQLSLAGTPTCRIEVSDNAVDPVGSQEAVIDPPGADCTGKSDCQSKGRYPGYLL